MDTIKRKGPVIIMSDENTPVQQSDATPQSILVRWAFEKIDSVNYDYRFTVSEYAEYLGDILGEFLGDLTFYGRDLSVADFANEFGFSVKDVSTEVATGLLPTTGQGESLLISVAPLMDELRRELRRIRCTEEKIRSYVDFGVNWHRYGPPNSSPSGRSRQGRTVSSENTARKLYR